MFVLCFRILAVLLHRSRANYAAVWTGTEMIVWGGDYQLQANGIRSIWNEARALQGIRKLLGVIGLFILHPISFVGVVIAAGVMIGLPLAVLVYGLAGIAREIRRNGGFAHGPHEWGALVIVALLMIWGFIVLYKMSREEREARERASQRKRWEPWRPNADQQNAYCMRAPKD